ncbi:hypothetical protein CYLTODRAFT_478632, partial [Cylindrobasidium torrendii FP15055 ss-10]
MGINIPKKPRENRRVAFEAELQEEEVEAYSSGTKDQEELASLLGDPTEPVQVFNVAYRKAQSNGQSGKDSKTYMFKRNEVKTKLKRKPPGPCRACGNPDHWNRECPDWELFLARTRKTEANFVGDSDYNTAWEILLSEEAAQDFELATPGAQNSGSVRCKSNTKTTMEVCKEEGEESIDQRTTEELIEKNEEYWTEDDREREAFFQSMKERPPKKPPPEPEVPTSAPSSPNSERTNNQQFPEYEAYLNEDFRDYYPSDEKCEAFGAETPGPPSKSSPIVLQPLRKRPPGMSALGLSVLSMRGSVATEDGPLIDQRLDSCANVSLMSYEFWKSLKVRPNLQKGRKLELYQLTSKERSIEGYCNLDLFTETEDGEVLQTNVEVYLVSGMTVPLLLGMDYHLNYKLTVSHDLEEGSRIRFADSEHLVRAREKMAHRRGKNARRRQREQARRGMHIARAVKDTVIKAHSCANVEVEGPFRLEEAYIVEKGLLEVRKQSYLAVPNALIDSHSPRIPVSNTSDTPRMIRRGEAIAWVSVAEDEVDVPENEAQRAEMEAYATTMKAL